MEVEGDVEFLEGGEERVKIWMVEEFTAAGDGAGEHGTDEAELVDAAAEFRDGVGG